MAQAFEQQRVVVAGTMRQPPPETLRGRVRVGGENARPGVGGPSGIAGVDQGDLCSPRGQFVGQREADETSPGDGHVTRLCAHDRQDTRSAPAGAYPSASIGAAMLPLVP